MYCTLLYLDAFKNELDSSYSTISLISQQTLQYSSSLGKIENKKLLVNPDCPVQILLDFICSEIGFDKTIDYDLCDCETGELLGIKLLKPWIPATKVMKSKQNYVVVFYEKDQYGQYTTVEPLIHKHSKLYPEVMQRLRRQLGSLRRSSSYKKNKRGSSSRKTLSSCSYKDELQRKVSEKN